MHKELKRRTDIRDTLKSGSKHKIAVNVDHVLTTSNSSNRSSALKIPSLPRSSLLSTPVRSKDSAQAKAIIRK